MTALREMCVLMATPLSVVVTCIVAKVDGQNGFAEGLENHGIPPVRTILLSHRSVLGPA